MDRKEPPKFKTTAEKTQDFYKTVEAGDITLFDLFEQAIAMFGFTKVGKTTTSHILCDNVLKAENCKGELVFRSNAQKYRTAKIGATTESETEIPNVFEKRIKDPITKTFKTLWLLDQPGYGDTYGFHRIFSNGYFHYRTFSKTPKLKFILAINYNDLRGTAEKFKKTISNFINAFADWEKVKPQILKATSFLITKVDVDTKLNTVKQILTTLSGSVGGMGPKQIGRYQQMIDEMLKNDKIFLVERPKSVGQCTLPSTILQQIYDKTTFWERDLSKTNRNIVDMSAINFSVSNQILKELRDIDNELFRTDFSHFMQYMQNRLNLTIQKHAGSLCNIVQTLMDDAVGSSDCRRFMELMEEFVNDNYNFYELYKEKREKTETSLFKSDELNESVKYGEQVNEEKIMKEARSVYFIKKFKVLEFIQKSNNENVGEDWAMADRTIEELQGMSTFFQSLFRKFSILRMEKNDNEKIIYKYSYIIQRLIEEYKIMTLILFKDSSTLQEFQKLKDIKIFSEDIIRMLKDKFFGGVVGEVKIALLKPVFIVNFSFDQLEVVNEEIVAFFEQGFTNDQKIQLKIAEMMIKYSTMLFSEDNIPTMEQKKFTLEKLHKYREKLYHYWKNLQAAGQKKSSQETCVFTVIKLTQQIAVILKHYNEFESARECYRSISDPEQIFAMYELETASESVKHDRKQHRQLLIKWAKQANTYFRKDLARKCCQKAYSLSSSYEEIKEAADEIVELCTEKKEEENEDSYEKKLFNDNFCSDFPDTLKDQIQTILIA